jgi:hypothetical protein
MVGNCGLDSSDSEQRPVADPCERDNEPSGSIKCGGFLNLLSDCNSLNKKL